MFIDESYFSGPLTIAQLGQGSVVSNLKDFINRFEPIVMEAALGYDFYQAFLEGLEVGSDEEVEQRWINLLNGFTFSNTYGVRKRFIGFAGGLSTFSIVAPKKDDLFIYGGTTAGFPVNGYTYTDASLKNWNFELEIFGLGTFQPGTEWNYKPGGGIVLTDTSYKVSPGEKWVLHFTGKKSVSIQPGSVNKVSPLAGIIYYEYMKDLASQNTGIGLVKSEGENSVRANPVRKPVDAFNEGAFQIRLLWEMFYADQDKVDKVYPEFKPEQVIGYMNECNFFTRQFNRMDETYSFRTKNVYGI